MDNSHHNHHNHTDHQDDSDLASAVGAAAAAHQLGLDDIPDHDDSHTHTPHSHYTLQQPDFSGTGHGIKVDDGGNGVDLNGEVELDGGVEVDVHGLDIPTVEEEEVGLRSGDDLDLGLSMPNQHELDGTRGGFGRPPSIRKGESATRTYQPLNLLARLFPMRRMSG